MHDVLFLWPADVICVKIVFASKPNVECPQTGHNSGDILKQICEPRDVEADADEDADDIDNDTGDADDVDDHDDDDDE